MSSLIIVDANKAGLEHLSFNSAMITALSIIAHHGGGSISVCCEHKHSESLSRELGASSDEIIWHHVPVISGFRRRFLRKWMVEVFVLSRILWRARRGDVRVFVLSIFPNALSTLLLAARVFKKVPLQIVLHAETEALEVLEKQAIHREGFWVKRALFSQYNGQWPKLFVLGSGIKHRLLSSYPDKTQLAAIDVLEHPYRFSKSSPDTRNSSAPVSIGFIGSGRRVKGIRRFFELARDLRGYRERGQIEFVVIGGVEAESKGAGGDEVRILAEQPAGLDAETYGEAVRALDCAVFLYEQNYRYTASGAVFDAIDAGVEIFTLGNYYLEDLREHDAEDGIRIFDTYENMRREIARRIDSGEGFARFAYGEIKKKHSCESVAVTLSATSS